MKFVSPQEAISHIPSHSTIFIHGAAATPRTLVEALGTQSSSLSNVTVVQIHTEGQASYLSPEVAHRFKTLCLFVGGNMRQAVAEGLADYVPVFLSEIPAIFQSRLIPLSVALIHVSAPDAHGYVSLGTSVDVARAAVESAEIVIAQVNPQMPRTHGDGIIHVSAIDYAVEVDTPLPLHTAPTIGEIESRIGHHVASLVEDGATLQMGIGAIPDAALSFLKGHKNLGIHTEMFSEGIIDLAESGVITGKCKKILPHKIVGSFLMGSSRLYNFVNDNPSVLLLQTSFVNDTHVIRQNPKVTAINSALEVDITGQVCADSIGTKVYSGIGGQMDFMRGAALSEGGRPIIALPSTTKRGESRIVSMLKPGAGVVTTRGHVRYIVTEYGIADLYAKPLRTRARLMIDIAHPSFRESLEREAYERFKVL